MIPSVEECKIAAADLLGDPLLRKFNQPKLHPSFTQAFLELTGEMQRYHLPKQKLGVVYVLIAGETAITPEQIGISNFGEIILMEERPYLSTDRYRPVSETDFLCQRQPNSLLREYEWNDDTWHFIGATQNIELRIWYYSSGAAPASGSTGIDGCLPFISNRMASIAAYPAGNVEMAKYYDEQARGPAPNRDGGLLHALLQPMVLSTNKIRLQLPYYTAQYWNRQRWTPMLVDNSGGGGGGSTDMGAPVAVTLTGARDGINPTFLMSFPPARLFVFLNGILLDEGTAYTRSGSTLTMFAPYIPQVGDNFRAEGWILGAPAPSPTPEGYNTMLIVGGFLTPDLSVGVAQRATIDQNVYVSAPTNPDQAIALGDLCEIRLTGDVSGPYTAIFDPIYVGLDGIGISIEASRYCDFQFRFNPDSAWELRGFTRGPSA